MYKLDVLDQIWRTPTNRELSDFSCQFSQELGVKESKEQWKHEDHRHN